MQKMTATKAHKASADRTALEGDDVVFMYPSANAEVYIEYGCTFLAWGGASKASVVKQLQTMGVHSTGSLWCLTAGCEKLHNDADLRDAVCRDVNLNPIPVWWLFDNTFEGTPTWFGCTNHPAFRAFVRQRVAEEMRGNAPGLHIDDHLGTAHTVAFLGGCFCDHCMSAFRVWLETNGSTHAMKIAGVLNWENFDYRALVRKHAIDDSAYQKQKESIPLYAEFLDCQLQLAAENVRQLGALAAQIVQRPITLSANTALPELPHITVTPYLTHLVGEVPHNAHKGTAALHEALHAYRMAETIGKPLAATARGQDWAWIKANQAINLVKIWIALGYCAGQRLMAPHRQWCFTLEKGNHWYEAPSHTYSPLYQFVRKHPDLFSHTTTLGPLTSPENVPRTFNTNADRAALHAALCEGKPQPLSAGNARLFPRRTDDGSLIIHLLNVDYLADGDCITSKRNLAVALPQYGIVPGATSEIYAYDAEPIVVPINCDGGVVRVIVPELRIWSVIVIRPTV